jgi:hypothetical protein
MKPAELVLRGHDGTPVLGRFPTNCFISLEAPLVRPNDRDIAIVGFAGKFPGAKSADLLWGNLKRGQQSIREFWFSDLYE